ncbi:hypothetical protein ACN47E_003406 [Coniothyrium glycines]
MAGVKVSTEFLKSCSNFEAYPENLIRGGTATYSSKLTSYRTRLNDVAPDLCLTNGEDNVENDYEIPVIDMGTANGTAMARKNIHSAEKLEQWLGLSSAVDPVTKGVKECVVSSRDPRCRFIYLYSQHSRDKLKTTLVSLIQLLTFHQVMPTYLDFILGFGAQSDVRDLRFSGFREQIRLKKPVNDLALPQLGRSGKFFQICYNLRGVQFKSRGNENVKLNEWSIHQAAFYHQFDVEHGTTLWIATKGGKDILERYKELIGPVGRPEDRTYDDTAACFRSSLSVHLLFCHWSTENWRGYIRWLEEVSNHQVSSLDDFMCAEIDTSHTGMTVDGLRLSGYAHHEYKTYHIQDLHHWQDKANEAVMVLEANASIPLLLRRFYADLVACKDFPSALKIQCEDELDTFFAQLDEITKDFHMQIVRAKLLVNTIGDRKELSFQHLQALAIERTGQLNQNLERDAVAIRIITIVTLLYLPATFVSTFFSTDIIKYQDQNRFGVTPDDGSFSSLALNRWLQVTLPLTVLTLFGAWTTYQIYERSREDASTSKHGGSRLKRVRPWEATPSEIASQTCQGSRQTWTWASLLQYFERSARLASSPLRRHDAHRTTLPLHDSTRR